MKKCLGSIALALTLGFINLTRADEDRLVLVGASYGKNVLAICDSKGDVIWRHDTEGPKKGHAGHHDVHLLKNGNILFHDSWVITQEITLNKEVIWKYNSLLENGNKGKKVGIHAFARLDNGETVIVESGVGRIIHLDSNKKITKQIPLEQNGRHQTRLMTLTDNGHYIVAAEKPGVVTEYSPEGKVLWEYETKTRVYGAIRLKNGNTLICTGSGNSVIEVNPEKEIVWQITKEELPNITLGWMTDLQELENGNIVIGNCHAGEGNPQIVELTKDKKVVWTFDEWDLVGNGLACWQILNAEQSKMVRDLLAK